MNLMKLQKYAEILNILLLKILQNTKDGMMVHLQ